ncbi:sarcosine oxidase subunit gamma family protein [Yoonia sp. SS1-5]|uniref:Sarcosine oxidase subunit gamma n=1 Tax=Yoonia rhodophyticola TaxID=3137370 RepID=A0AAN0M7D9_9RHOB
MSDALTALRGKSVTSDVTITDAGLQGMITLRGDLSDKKLGSICKTLTGQAFPDQGLANCEGAQGLCWMSPDEVLVLVPYAQVNEALASLDKALAGKHYLAQNVSDARALIRVEGAFAREVIAKLAPVDLHPMAFEPGDFRRSRLGQIAAAFWMPDDDSFAVICFRSVAEYAFDLLVASANAGAVGHFPQD